MTDQDQITTIAEALEWKDVIVQEDWITGHPPGSIVDSFSIKQQVPNFFADWNTRPQMLAVLDRSQRIEVWTRIARTNTGFEILSLSQSDFCRAFLKAIGKWKE